MSRYRQDKFGFIEKKSEAVVLNRIDLPQHNLALEQIVLGIYIDSPGRMNSFNQESLSTYFIDLRHRTIHRYMLQIGPSKLDLQGLKNRLKETQCLESCGGVDYINALAEVHARVGRNINLPKCLGILEKLYFKRKELYRAEGDCC